VLNPRSSKQHAFEKSFSRREYCVATNINPDPHADGFQWQPTNSVTAIVDKREDLNSALASLKQAGFSGEDLSIFIGREGLEKLDVRGEAHGISGRLIRAWESVTADQHPDKEVESALQQGRIYIAVCTHNDDGQRTIAEQTLKAHNAHNIRYFGRWAVEHS